MSPEFTNTNAEGMLIPSLEIRCVVDAPAVWQPRHFKGDGKSVRRPIKPEPAEWQNPRQSEAK
jgi:hypothetical protein